MTVFSSFTALLEKVGEQFVLVARGACLILMTRSGSIGMSKATAVFFGAAFLGIAQWGPFVYEKESAVMKAQYALEDKVKVPLAQIDCNKPGSLQLDCKIAKQELATLTSTMGAFNVYVFFLLRIGFLCAVLTVIGFVGVLFRELSPSPKSDI